MSFLTDNPDLLFHLREGVDWDGFVPLWEDDFRSADGPASVAEAREIYEESLSAIGTYAAREIAPRARRIDEEGVTFAGGKMIQPSGLLENIEGLKKLGAMGPSLPREWGGLNFPFTVAAAATEIIGRACTNTMLLHAFYQGPALMIWRFGTPEQAARWVEPLAAGALSGAVAMTEPQAGSDLGALTTRAEEERPGVWRLTGRKQFITNGCGDVCIVLARSEAGSKGLEGLSLFVAPRDKDGSANYGVAPPEKKFVIRGSATCELIFDGSQAELLGPRGAGFQEILTFMNEARVAVALQGLGLSQAALSAARGYAEQRVQMGRPIARHELVADLLGDMEAELAAMRALVYRCSSLHDRLNGLERCPGRAKPGEAEGLRRQLRDRTPLVKWFGAERTLWITRAAVQVHGGYGVMQEYDVERLYRNALILPIYEGTSQIQALMSLKDQIKWASGRPWRFVTGLVDVQTPFTALGDAVKEMAAEYGCSLRHCLGRSPGWRVLLAAAVGRRSTPDATSFAGTLARAERLVAMLSYTRAAEALVVHANAGRRRLRLAERFVHRSLPLVRMLGEQVRGPEGGALDPVETEGAGHGAA